MHKLQLPVLYAEDALRIVFDVRETYDLDRLDGL
jgi:hypothetical protein